MSRRGVNNRRKSLLDSIRFRGKPEELVSSVSRRWPVFAIEIVQVDMLHTDHRVFRIFRFAGNLCAREEYYCALLVDRYRARIK